MIEHTDTHLPLAEWPHLFRPGAADTPVLLMLHGTGGDEQQIASLAEQLHPQAGVLAPRGRVTESGMLRWFRRLSEGVFDTDDVVRRAGELAGFIVEAREHYELGDRQIVAVGFSNGANIALATGLLHPGIVSRVIAFSGMHPLSARDAAGTATEPADLSQSRFLVLNGDADAMAPLASANALVALLRARGADVTQEVRGGGHGIAASELAAAQAWLAPTD
jgi:phospholipase/carboxylesterase